MKKIQTLFVCAAMMLTAACTSEDVTDDMSNEFKVVGAIAPSAPMSRVQMGADGAGIFTANDKNTLFFHDGNSTLSTMTYEYGKNYFWYDLNLPEATTTCQLSACYPVVSTATPKNFAWDVTAQTSNPDLLVAAATPVTVHSTAPIHLTFGHVMHKLAVELSSSEVSITEDILNQAKVVLGNYQPVANVNLFTGAINSVSGAKTAATQTGAKTAFIVPVQAVGNMNVTLTLKGKTETFNLADCKISGQSLVTLESGKSFVLKINVTKGGFVIAGQTITGWGDQGSHEDSFEI